MVVGVVVQSLSCVQQLWPHKLQHARLLCPQQSPRVCSNSCLLSWWCHPTISSSVTLFSFCPQSCPASASFPMSQLFASDGQTIGASASVSVHPVNIQGWFLFGLSGLISLQSKGFSWVFSSTTTWKHQFSTLSLPYGPTLTSKQVPEALDQTWIPDVKTTFTCIPTTLLTVDPQGPGGHQAKGTCISLLFEGMSEWIAQQQSLGIQC